VNTDACVLGAFVALLVAIVLVRCGVRWVSRALADAFWWSR
jgi:hypothetical protein